MYYIFMETFGICEWDRPSTRNFFVSRLTNITFFQFIIKLFQKGWNKFHSYSAFIS